MSDKSDEESDRNESGKPYISLDRYLPLLLVLVGVICVIGLIGRALTG
jgi:hypothetical protein